MKDRTTERLEWVEDQLYRESFEAIPRYVVAYLKTPAYGIGLSKGPNTFEIKRFPENVLVCEDLNMAANVQMEWIINNPDKYAFIVTYANYLHYICVVYMTKEIKRKLKNG